MKLYVGVFFNINISSSQSSWMVFTFFFIFTFTFHCSNSLFHKEELYSASQKAKELTAHFSLDLFSKFNCINFISRGVNAEDILFEVYKMFVSPIVIGSNDMNFPCKEYFMIVNSSYQALVAAESLRFRSRDHVIIVNLNDDCPEGKLLNTTLFGAAQVVVICSAHDSVYRQEISGDLHVATNKTKLFQKKTSAREDYMGRFLRVSTFNCPPYSYGTGNGVNSSTYQEKSKHHLDLSISNDSRILLQRVPFCVFRRIHRISKSDY
jgi:hypothetical protein